MISVTIAGIRAAGSVGVGYRSSTWVSAGGGAQISGPSFPWWHNGHTLLASGSYGERSVLRLSGS